MPLDRFLRHQLTGAILLMLCTIAALVLANSPLAAHYQAWTHAPLGLHVGGLELEKTLQHWINDGLMAVFFLLVGLEIKREMLIGELADPRRAALPIIAAVGGMIVPAAIYLGFNTQGAAMRGWGIPMATDIAFAVGVLLLLGKRAPRALVMFLLALAIIDDLGAVLVIALFYTDTLSLNFLALAAALFAACAVFNLRRVHRLWPYLVVGVFLWVAMLQSGIHATLAGVLLAATIPARHKSHAQLAKDSTEPMNPPSASGASLTRHDNAQAVEQDSDTVKTPLARLHSALDLPVSLLIVPLFAFANAGVSVRMTDFAWMLMQPVTVGVALGLVLGKLIGIAGSCWLALKLGIGTLPAQITMRHIVGIGLLGGIGFTLSLFVTELGFATHSDYALMAKIGVLVGSLCAGLCGYFWLRFAVRVPAI